MKSRKLKHAELIERQQRKMHEPPLPFCVVLNNIRSLYNVGSIFRTADGAGVEKIYLCGITGHPPSNQITKTALGAEERVAWEHCDEVLPVLKTLKAKHYQIVFLEQIEGSVSYETFEPQEPICLVLGNEIEGVQEEALAYCDQSIEIDMAGVKNSLNVSVAFGIVAYHIRNQLNHVRRMS